MRTIKFLVFFFMSYSISIALAAPFFDSSKNSAYQSKDVKFSDGMNWAEGLSDVDFKDAVHYNVGKTISQVPSQIPQRTSLPSVTLNKTEPQKVEQQQIPSQSIPEPGPMIDMMNLNNEVNMPSYNFQRFHDSSRGEILIHRPAPIIVKRPPTKVIVNHPPLVVKPAPVVFHRPPAVIVRPVIVRSQPQPVKVQPVYVKVVRPSENSRNSDDRSCNKDNAVKDFYDGQQNIYNGF